MNRIAVTSPPELDLTILTTARNEEGNLNEFLQRSVDALDALNIRGEIIVFDDASSDGTFAMARSFAERNPRIAMTIIRSPAQKGIVHAVVRGSSMARGKFICFVPADLESLPDEDIPLLYKAVDDDIDVVTGWRQGRGDNKALSSAIYNSLNRFLFNVNVHDSNWIKLVRREKLDNLVLLSDWHSIFVGLLAVRGCRIKEVKTQWHQRKFGRSKFGARRFVHAIAAAISGRAYLAFGERPLLLFLELSTFCLFVAFVAATVAVILPGSNVVLMLLSFTSVLLASISASAGLSVEALRWGRMQGQIQLDEGQKHTGPNNFNMGSK